MSRTRAAGSLLPVGSAHEPDVHRSARRPLGRARTAWCASTRSRRVHAHRDALLWPTCSPADSRMSFPADRSLAPRLRWHRGGRAKGRRALPSAFAEAAAGQWRGSARAPRERADPGQLRRARRARPRGDRDPGRPLATGADRAPRRSPTYGPVPGVRAGLSRTSATSPRGLTRAWSSRAWPHHGRLTPHGSVALAETYTGIYPAILPGGWRVIGRTSVLLFDPAAEPPTYLLPGDTVRFEAVAAGDLPAEPHRPADWAG